MIKIMLLEDYHSESTRQLFDAINEAADVEDNRHKFF
jgi:hypothetical protein